MQIEITEQYVYYAAETRLLELAREIADSRSLIKPDIKVKKALATKIRLWLEALDYGVYLDRDTREKIWYCLADVANVNQNPVTITTSNIQPPSLIVGIKGDTGDTGSTGLTGGGIAFSASNVSVDTVVDSFDITLTGSAQWQYEIFDSTNKRVEILIGTWLPSGLSFADDGGITLDPSIGDTSGITFQVNINVTTVQLLAIVTTGTWEIRGSRILIPVSGNGITLPTSLANDTIWIGNSSNQPQSRTISGDISITNSGVASIGTGVIVNSDINGTAAIAVSKLAAMTASKAVITDTNGFLTTSVTDASKVAYLSNVRSDIQAQIDALAGAGTITGAITPYVTSDAIASRVVVSNPSGKLTTSLTTTTELSYVSGVTSSIQTQINNKFTDVTTTIGDIIYRNGSNVTARLPIGSTGQVLTVSGGLPTWSSSIGTGVTSVATSTYTVLNTDNIVHMNNVANRTVTMFASASATIGKPVWIKDSARKASTNPITIQRAGSDVFEDGSTSFQITADGDVVGIYWGGTKWYLI